MRVLFICKKNEHYGFQSYHRKSSGLYNSTHFIVEALKKRGVHAAIVEVADNNSIDKEVAYFKPNLVIIEALWVVPEKFEVLKKLHPNVVQWFVHLHSHIPFLALEGIAMEWLQGYRRRGVGIITNSKQAREALHAVFGRDSFGLDYLPNVYIPHEPQSEGHIDSPAFHVGCFGAIRPLKNQLIQALAAIEYGKETGQFVYFHVNTSRVETGGAPILKNLQELFKIAPNAALIAHMWMEPPKFLELLARMDIGLQVSLTETFNVVTADYITAGLPVVVSPEIGWVSRCSQANPHDVKEIVKKMHLAMGAGDWLVRRNRRKLEKMAHHAQAAWFDWVERWLR